MPDQRCKYCEAWDERGLADDVCGECWEVATRLDAAIASGLLQKMLAEIGYKIVSDKKMHAM